jgi:DNA-binding GntR family transcriptional regulator
MSMRETSASSVLTLADKAEAMLQADILSGRLAPEQRLALPALEKRLGIGLTPMREALSRLVRQGLVTFEGNKGFRVAKVSAEDLVDLTETRTVIESSALRRSMEKKPGEWQDGIVASIHRLTRVVRQFDGLLADNLAEYEKAHKAFHAALIAGCGLPRLIEIQSGLYDQAFRYRQLTVNTGIDKDKLVAEHQHLANLALGNDIDAACDALRRHLALTKEAVFPLFQL